MLFKRPTYWVVFFKSHLMSMYNYDCKTINTYNFCVSHRIHVWYIWNMLAEFIVPCNVSGSQWTPCKRLTTVDGSGIRLITWDVNKPYKHGIPNILHQQLSFWSILKYETNMDLIGNCGPMPNQEKCDVNVSLRWYSMYSNGSGES